MQRIGRALSKFDDESMTAMTVALELFVRGPKLASALRIRAVAHAS